MKNVDRLARHITKHGAENIMIHTIPGTSNWLICEKIEKNKWVITLGSPMGNVIYNLGIVSDAQHIEIWGRLIKQQLEIKATQILLAKELKNHIRYFIKEWKSNHEKTYKKFIKIEKEKTKHEKTNKKFIKTKEKETKHNRPKLRKRSKRSKKSTS